ncbi:MAG: response regulator [Pseudomonadota bacterium]
MSKIMLVLDNKDDQEFLDKIMGRLKYQVISMTNGSDLSAQLIDHFPDVVFASTLGRNQRILNALGKIKQVRGKPKLVFVKQQKETSSLTAEQKKIIDGVLYSPVDPSKLIDVLAHTTDVDIADLRQRYNDMLDHDRGASISVKGAVEDDDLNFKKVSSSEKSQDFGSTQVIGKKRKKGEETIDYVAIEGKEIEGEAYKKPDVGVKSRSHASSPLIYDESRKKKYDELTKKLKAENPPSDKIVDIQKLRELQNTQSQEITEDKSVKENRKHFLKTLFTMDTNSVKKDS